MSCSKIINTHNWTGIGDLLIFFFNHGILYILFFENYILLLFTVFFYASPTSGEAYRDRRLTTNFELWVEIFCVPTCFHMRIPKPCLSVCLSVCPHPEKRYHHSFVNISLTLLIDTSMERSPRVHTPWKPRNVNFFQKVRNWRNWILSVPRVSVCREKKSPWLRQYQSYIRNWYVNGKVFTSTTTWEP